MPLQDQDPGSIASAWEPLRVLGTVFVLGGLAGLAALLRSNEHLSRRAIYSAIINSSFIALIVAMIWWSKYHDTNLFFLFGISILAGFGGNTTIGLAIAYCKKRLNVKDEDIK